MTSARVRRKPKSGEGFHRQLRVIAAGAFTHTRPNTHTHTPAHTLGQHRGNVTSNELCRSAGLSIRITLAHREFFFLRRRSVSTCYPLSAPCPSVSQRHPNAPQLSVTKKKKKCDFGEEKLRGSVLQLFSVVHLLKVTALCFTYFRYKVADSTCATFLSNCRKRLFQYITRMNVITVIQNHHSSTLIHQIKSSKNRWNVFLVSTGETVPFRKGMPLKKNPDKL